VRMRRWGRRSIVWSTVVLGLTAAYLGGYLRGVRPDVQVAPEKAGGGAAAFDPAVVELGPQPWATELPITLYFGNWGSEVVTVQEVKTSCGCLVLDTPGSLEGEDLKPGEIVALQLLLQTQKAVGPHRRTVTVVLTNGETNSATIDLECQLSLKSRHGLSLRSRPF
jgi:hypothetical protein